MSEVTLEVVVAEVVRSLDGVQLPTFGEGSEMKSNDDFTTYRFEAATAELKLLFYHCGGLTYLAVVDLNFQAASSLERTFSVRITDEELELLLADSPVKVVSSLERFGFVQTFARVKVDLLRD